MYIQIEIDGWKIQVPEGTNLIEAAKMAGIKIPHFCYHKELSIAANCRMCLVDVEKSPKPVPACATMVTDGMVVQTSSTKAKKAQHGVMEFLLINHPLECPICDEGGECELQDLAVGYGVSNSRYLEEKRIVVEKNLGPLIATDMKRCIHCTRCVRFGREIGGLMELGMVGRGEHSEIMPFIERTVDSELSGNMVDVCPVGALTSKPFRFTARSWELSNRSSISAHDAWGSNVRIQIKSGLVKRVLPKENDEVNHCWISDRDRFAYLGLDADDRAVTPMIRPSSAKLMRNVEWPEALDVVASRIKNIVDSYGSDAIGFLASPQATLEELFLLQKLARGLGCPHIDHRLHQHDFSLDNEKPGIPWFGMPINQIDDIRHALIVGANPARELPLFAYHLRKIVERNGKIASIGPIDITSQIPVENQQIVSPSVLPEKLAAILMACREQGAKVDFDGPGWIQVDDAAHDVAKTLLEGNSAIWMGMLAQSGPNYGILRKLAFQLAESVGATFGILCDGANTIGAHLVGAIPYVGHMGAEVQRGLDVASMISERMKSYVLFGCEPEDFARGHAMRNALSEAELVVSMNSYTSGTEQYADILLPTAPFTETVGVFVNLEGRAQPFDATVKPLGNARPGWKILRVLGQRLGLEGFGYEQISDVREEILANGADYGNLLSNSGGERRVQISRNPPQRQGQMERITEIPAYRVDPIVRRSAALQKTRISKIDCSVGMHPQDISALNLDFDGFVILTAGDNSINVKVHSDRSIAVGCVRIPVGVPDFELLDLRLPVEVAPAEKREEVATTV